MKTFVFCLAVLCQTITADEVNSSHCPALEIDLHDTIFMSAAAELNSRMMPRASLRLVDVPWFIQSGQASHPAWNRLLLLETGRFQIWSAAISNDDAGILLIEGTWAFTTNGTLLFDGYGFQGTARLRWDGDHWRWIMEFAGGEAISFEQMMGC